MSKITEIKAIQVLDSRGVPTVSCSITLDNNISANSIVPSGASTGTKEALELRDGNTDYLGIIINSWISILLSACSPPFKIFNIGIGRLLLTDELVISW